MLSEVDFERAESVTDDGDQTSYYSEEVTDNEAMRAKKFALGIDEDDSDDDFGGGYIPSVAANSPSMTKPKVEKITKKVKKKKVKKPTTSKKPPRGVTTSASPNQRVGSPDMKPTTPAQVMSDN